MSRQTKRRVFSLLEARRGGTIGRVVDWAIAVLIVLNVLAAIALSVEPLFTRYGMLFHAFELFSVAVFSVEYVARLWSCTVSPKYRHPISGRLRFVATPAAVGDLLAIAPFYLAPLLLPALGAEAISAFILFRLVRLVKLARYFESTRVTVRVLNRRRQELAVSLFLGTILLVVSASVMYFLERDAQPDAFSNILDSVWWASITLTTVGYGDVYPVTPLGKAVGAVIALLGISFFAIPAGIIASGFVAEFGRKRTCPHCGERLESEYD